MQNSRHRKIPYKEITLAVVLLVLGTIMLTLGSLMLTGHLPDAFDRGYPLVILGAILFIPGSYNTYTAYWAWRGAEGYSFSQIPQYE